jgi:hypothetical protein
MIDWNVMNQASTAPEIFKTGNNVAVATGDGFCTIKRSKATKETSSISSQSLKENKQRMIGVGTPPPSPLF